MAPARRSDPLHQGFVLLDKPAGTSSFQVLAPIKRTFETGRVGHAGTLDQEASGLIVAAVGRVTRLLPFVESRTKTYDFTLHLGRQTDTLEYEGEVLFKDAEGARTEAQLCAVIPRFLGDQLQMPPEYSAIKIAGKRASDRVRAGETIELKPRPVHLYSLDILPTIPNGAALTFRMRLVCSKGTYVRALARDLGKALGTYGCSSAIRRLAIGGIPVESAHRPEGIDVTCLMDPRIVLGWPCLILDTAQSKLMANGQEIPWSDASFSTEPSAEVGARGSDECMVFLQDEAGALLGAGVALNDRIVPKYDLRPGN